MEAVVYRKIVWTVILIVGLVLVGCDRVQKTTRENIFDHHTNIPTNLEQQVPYLPPLCDEINDLKKGFVDIKGGKLYYEEEGHGIPLVLINGGPGGTHHGFHPYFSQMRDVARVIYYDQRGTGKSSYDNTGKTYTVKQAVQDLETLRKALNIKKWAVLGWSYGGLLAQCYALAYPEHVIGLILVASQSGVHETFPQSARDKMFITPTEQDAINIIKRKTSDGTITTAQSIYNQHLAGDWKRYNYYKPTQQELIRKALYEWQPAPGFENAIQADENTINLKGKFENFKIPTLILEPRWDLVWWNPGHVDVMRKNHPHAQLEVFEKSGHKMFADEPEKFFKILKDFLQRRVRLSPP
jgi:proline iminopeptidase